VHKLLDLLRIDDDDVHLVDGHDRGHDVVTVSTSGIAAEIVAGLKRDVDTIAGIKRGRPGYQHVEILRFGLGVQLLARFGVHREDATAHILVEDLWGAVRK